jgi:hypothetical protein
MIAGRRGVWLWRIRLLGRGVEGRGFLWFGERGVLGVWLGGVFLRLGLAFGGMEDAFCAFACVRTFHCYRFTPIFGLSGGLDVVATDMKLDIDRHMRGEANLL